MMSAQLLAAMLLLIRVASIVYISRVIVIQWSLFKLPIAKEVSSFRKVLFLISLAIFLGNMIPMFTNLQAFVTGIHIMPLIPSLTVAYAASDALSALLSSLLIWLLYKKAQDSHE